MFVITISLHSWFFYFVGDKKVDENTIFASAKIRIGTIRGQGGGEGGGYR